MVVLVYAEHQGGVFKKSAFEAVTYAKKTAEILGGSCVALTIGNAQGAGELGVYGAEKVLQVTGPDQFDSQVYAAAIAQAAEQAGASVVIMQHSSTGKALLGRVAVRLGAGSVAGANSLPLSGNGLRVHKNVFSGKAIAEVEVVSDKKVLSLMGNTVQPEAMGQAVAVENISLNLPDSRVRIKEVKRVEGTVPLPEADLVVSGGRGLKGPEHWAILEDLANALGATTACSRPVADSGWRPHHEHVGQTGIAIRPNLYIALGISGAIQHQAGVSSSKVIVVINKDPEAPFFKIADYGVVGDLFEVTPKLTEAVKKFKGIA